MSEYVIKAIVFLPLISGIINGIFCKKISNLQASLVATVPIIITALCAISVFIGSGINKEVVHVIIARWISLEFVTVNWVIYVDQLTSIMFLLVSFVSSTVHIYSLGYMSDDKNLPKFLSYLSLFTFFMLALVSADNFLQLFFGWEGVGLCSYLLVGYYYHKESANKAAVKAFIVNRISDCAFIIGMVMILIYTESLEFGTVFARSTELANMSIGIMGYKMAVIEVICLLLFIGCMGKSAQIGLHVWLPDAMEGPTPVSALIHAATMVTAGVFLVARCSFMFEYARVVLEVITIVGAGTCLFAASIAIGQTDIKKIIAYSTCSQLGYMFLACGVSAYQVGVFHLVTHGFFKALLFLSAGSVIHATHEQEIFKMGGLRSKLPITYANFWMGTLAIIGIFPLAGFYSKDLVLESAYLAGSNVGTFAFGLGIIAAVFTAIYSFKIMIVVFHGRTKMSEDDFSHVHESPKIMNIPLLILVAGTLFSGMIGYYILIIDNPQGFFAGSIFNLHGGNDHEHHTPLLIQNLPLIVGIAGSIIGVYCYKNELQQKIAQNLGSIYFLIKNRYFFDEFYDLVVVRLVKTSSSWARCFDVKIIDRFGPNGFGYLARSLGWIVSKAQTGYLFSYALYIILSLVLCITVFIIIASGIL